MAWLIEWLLSNLLQKLQSKDLLGDFFFLFGNSEIDKLKQDFELLENRVTKDIGNVVDSYRRADQAMYKFLDFIMALNKIVKMT